MTKEECEEAATKVLEKFKVKNDKMFKRLFDIIQATGKSPAIRVFWNSRAEELQFEVVEET